MTGYEQYKWNSVTYYIDLETGEQVEKSEIGVKYIKGGLIDSNIRIDRENYIKTIYRTVSCKKIQAIQLNLSL